ncbi:hypothetical protein QMK28_24110 [Streptomyces sp. H27-D2]|nr:hypothetical protein [Streptomyces sp. H27-D2]MEC4019301.1 hypothetical protein [Streptomyces sp. H27-D2]
MAMEEPHVPERAVVGERFGQQVVQGGVQVRLPVREPTFADSVFQVGGRVVRPARFESFTLQVVGEAGLAVEAVGEMLPKVVEDRRVALDAEEGTGGLGDPGAADRYELKDQQVQG